MFGIIRVVVVVIIMGMISLLLLQSSSAFVVINNNNHLTHHHHHHHHHHGNKNNNYYLDHVIHGSIISSSSSSSLIRLHATNPTDWCLWTDSMITTFDFSSLSLASSSSPSPSSLIMAQLDMNGGSFWSNNHMLMQSLPSFQSLTKFIVDYNNNNNNNIDWNMVKERIVQAASIRWHAQVVTLAVIVNTITYVVSVMPDRSISTTTTTNSKNNETPYAPDNYNPDLALQFFKQRPLPVIRRVLKLVWLTTPFTSGLLWDWLILGKLLGDNESFTALKENEPRRARQALRLCEQLGPTFIKLGQALSIRTDLIPELYALELRQLQDAVPPFDSKVAKQVLRNELNVNDLSIIFKSLSKYPVASASIGQVYRGILKSNGKDVAVKVQRPGVLYEIALDLYILRWLVPIQTQVQNMINGIKTTQEDIDLSIALVDEWGRGFVAETNYQLEAMNTKQFQVAMNDRGLNAVIAPTIIEDLITDSILVTEWVNGTRLDRDASPDVPRLCGVAINAYLTMLLDTGVLHCDPHPGNLLRTTDGKLCILDWGMTLSVPNNLQYALLELIAHINVEDYDAIPADFINLGFSPEGVTAEKLRESGITEGLTFALRQLSQGGGPKKIQQRVKAEFQQRYGNDLSDDELRNAARAEMLQKMEEQLANQGVDVKGVTNVMEEISRRNKQLFQLPPYVLYVARAFSTLEGIGLSIDENYAIVQECYPYLARRLFTDRSPRAKRALRAMLGLSEQQGVVVEEKISMSNMQQQQQQQSSSLPALVASGGGRGGGGALSASKLVEMSDGFASYTAATADTDRDGAGRTAATRELIKLLLSPNGSALQDILVEETARLGDAATRRALRAALVESAPAKAAAKFLQDRKERIDSNPLMNMILPEPLREVLVDRPAELPGLMESILAWSPNDERLVQTVSDLAQVVLNSRSTNDQETGSGTDLDAAAARISSLASPQSSSLSSSSFEDTLAAAQTLLASEEARQFWSEQAPGVSALGRRLCAELLRRAADRTHQTKALPISPETRQALADWNRRWAETLDASNTPNEDDKIN